MKNKISIPAPCNQNWDEMTQTEQGRICASCKHTVVDYTDNIEKAIMEAHNNNEESICGRFRSEDLTHRPVFTLFPAQQMSRLRRYFVAAMAFLGIYTVSAQSTLPTSLKAAGTFELRDSTEKSAEYFQFIGNIQETDGETIERAFVLLESEGITLAQSYTDEKGNFTLEIPLEKQTDDSLTFYVSHVGRHFVATGLEWRSQNIHVSLQPYALDERYVVEHHTKVGTITLGAYLLPAIGKTTSIHSYLGPPRRGFSLEDEIFMNRSDVQINRF